MSGADLLWGMLFGTVGMSFFVYGRRQSAMVPLISGVALMGFPYFVSDTVTLVAVGILLVGAGLFVRL